MNEQILIVEDDPALRQVMCAYLAGEGFRALPAADGEEALRL